MKEIACFYIQFSSYFLVAHAQSLNTSNWEEDDEVWETDRQYSFSGVEVGAP